MLIPSIDLMDGKIVQLVQGEKKALEFDNFEDWALRFASFPLIQLIDLDAATAAGSNSELIEFFVRKLPCQVGGGIRNIETARQILALGARRVIFGSSLIDGGRINTGFAEQAAEELGPDKLVFAIDARRGTIAIRGWREATDITPVAAVRALEPYCSAFLYTHIDTEGLLAGIPLSPVRELRAATNKKLIVAGGISSREEIDMLDQMGVDAVVGMALYLGKLNLPDTIPLSK
jgi:phosphoribosylformimino-5-aminoimidazole carboxamide ribotide isomerase